jgi:hypothetical protein
MPSGHEYNRWNLPLNQLPMKFMNYREWGNPLTIGSGGIHCPGMSTSNATSYSRKAVTTLMNSSK